MAPLKVILSISESYGASTDPDRSKILFRYGEYQRHHISVYGSHFLGNQNRLLPAFHKVTDTQHSSIKQQSLSDYSDTMEEDHSPSPLPKAPKRTRPTSTTPTAKRFKGESRFDDIDDLMESETSPIYKDGMPLKKVLAHPLARSTLAGSHFGRALQNAEADELSSAFALFKEDGQQGRHGPEWTAQALAAHHTRQVGGFQEYEKAKFQQHFASASRELSDEEDDKATKTSKGVNSGKRVCNADKKHCNRNFDDDGDDDMERGNPFSSGAFTSRTGSGFSTVDSNNAQSNSGNCGNDNSNNPQSYGKNRSASHTRYDFGVSPSSDIVDKSSGVHVNHLTTLPYRLIRRYSVPSPTTIPVLKFNCRYGMVDLELQALAHGLNEIQTRIALNNALMVYEKENEVAVNSDFQDWPGRGYVDNPNSVYPELIYFPGYPVIVVARRQKAYTFLF